MAGVTYFTFVTFPTHIALKSQNSISDFADEVPWRSAPYLSVLEYVNYSFVGRHADIAENTGRLENKTYGYFECCE